MSNFNSAPHNQAEYYLTSEKLGRRLIIEPDGWQTDFPTIKRSQDNAGLVNKITLDISFYGSGASYLRALVENFGTEEEVVLEKWIMHATEMRMHRVYRAYLQLDEYEDKDEFVTCKAEESGILSQINTYKTEKLELGRLTALNGNVLSALSTRTVPVPGKQILLVSQFNRNESNVNYVAPSAGVVLRNATALPFDIVSSQDIKAHSVTDFVVNVDGSPFGPGSTGNMFYADNDRIKDLEFTIDVDFDFDISQSVGLYLVEYSDGSLYNYVSHELLKGETGNKLTYQGTIIRADIPAGTSYAIVAFSVLFGTINYTFNKLDLTITENSYFPATNSKVLLPYERIERLLQIITGRTDKSLFYSQALGRIDLGYTEDGDFAYLGSSSGFWARNFNDKEFVTSWDKTIKTFFSIKNLAFAVVKTGELETIILEPLKWFYQNGPIFDFPLVASNIERKIAKEFQYSSINIGYNKGGADYEEAMGLVEVNGRHNYSLPFKRSERIYDLISPDRGDMTGYEFARRKPFNQFPTEDTRYDEDNFIMELKLVDGQLEQVLWPDLYEIEPTEIYSPNTSTNLGITPKRNLLNHGFWINGGLSIFRTQNLIFNSATGNQLLTTKVAGADTLQEKQDYPISLLEDNRFTTRWIEFNHKVSAQFAQLLNGSTYVNGRLIPNIYFRWRFLNDKGEYETCRIWDVDPRNEGKFKVLKI